MKWSKISCSLYFIGYNILVFNKFGKKVVINNFIDCSCINAGAKL